MNIAAIKFRRANAVTNFEMSHYKVEAIAKSSIPVGGIAKHSKLPLEAKGKPPTNANLQIQSSSNNINFAPLQQPVSTITCGIPFDVNFFHHLHPTNAGVSVAALTMVTPMPVAGSYDRKSGRSGAEETSSIVRPSKSSDGGIVHKIAAGGCDEPSSPLFQGNSVCCLVPICSRMYSPRSCNLLPLTS
ncbi:unnamed protein product [Fraxinus pennsylvanica]|uniref:Uncharacterized protein n=1 Tax=Fraxinus pennsylvanica TaxID=56036 RepID=A0AAD2DQZ4_9LAMI|nr:unnamed protein product [Fraxinus pennsylvanica]